MVVDCAWVIAELLIRCDFALGLEEVLGKRSCFVIVVASASKIDFLVKE